MMAVIMLASLFESSSAKAKSLFLIGLDMSNSRVPSSYNLLACVSTEFFKSSSCNASSKNLGKRLALSSARCTTVTGILLLAKFLLKDSVKWKANAGARATLSIKSSFMPASSKC